MLSTEKYQKIQRYKNINQEKIGETRINNQGEIMFIVEYINYMNIKVQFKSTSEVIQCTYQSFIRGSVKSHFSATVFGIGITGMEKINDNIGNKLNSYICWVDMLKRCYSEKYLNKKPTYRGCTVCEEWLYYCNFKKWYNDNYYEINNEKMQLDKDILKKGNKVYSPENCVFVPGRINLLFTKRDAKRGDLPIGVSFNKRDKIFNCSCSDNNGKNIWLGRFKNLYEAFQVYKHYKEKLIKNIADKYKNEIPDKLYQAMINWKVEITD